jgi:ABC-2 type transport system ATP-binding protein
VIELSILEARNLTKEFGSLVAVNNLSFTINAGQVVGLIGPNGAGKTTLLRMMATLLKETSGQLLIDELDTAIDYLKVRGRIGYLPDFFKLYPDLTLEECLTFFARAYGIATETIASRVNEVLEFIYLEDKRHDLIKNLSRGMMQRLGVGTLLVHDPDIYLLDEPASGLDPRGRIELRKILTKLSEQGKTVIISSHILTELTDFCTHIALMNKGKIEVFGSVTEIEKQISHGIRVQVTLVDEVDKAVTLLNQITHVKILSQHKNIVIFETTREGKQLAEILTQLISEGFCVTNFQTEKRNLEDLFMEISGHMNEKIKAETEKNGENNE